jgi:hypothetical protein
MPFSFDNACRMRIAFSVQILQVKDQKTPTAESPAPRLGASHYNTSMCSQKEYFSVFSTMGLTSSPPPLSLFVDSR